MGEPKAEEPIEPAEQARLLEKVERLRLWRKQQSSQQADQAEVVEKSAEEAKAEEPTETFVLPSAGLVFISEGEIEEPPEKAPTVAKMAERLAQLRLAQLQKTVGIVAWSRCQHG